MKFSDLEIGDQFYAVEGDEPEILLEKAKHKNPTCCSPEHNSVYAEGDKKRKNRRKE